MQNFYRIVTLIVLYSKAISIDKLKIYDIGFNYLEKQYL